MQAMPLDDTGLDALVEALAQCGAQPLEFVDGLYSALVVGPETATPGDGLALLWPEDGEACHDPALLETLTTQLAALWDHVHWRLAQPLPDEDQAGAMDKVFAVMPFLLSADSDDEADEQTRHQARDAFPHGQLWAVGFLQGVGLHAEAWMRWFDQHADLAADFERLLRLSFADAEQLQASDMHDSLEAMDADERFQACISLPWMLQQMHLQHLRDETLAQPRRREPEPGRNDPCHCGSGRKYKHCCLGGVTLH